MTVYIDNNATTRVAKEVLEAMIPYYSENYFNPGGLYKEGEAVQKAVAEARHNIADFFKVDDDEIIFTSCATESNNTAIRGALNSMPERKHIITTQVEHPAVLNVCKDLERHGYEVTYLPVDEDGNLHYVDLINALRPDTALVSIMHANNETGVVFPIDKLSKIVKKTDPMIVFHTDATQSVGKIKFNIADDMPYVDMLSMSGHKVYGPKGIGLLYKKKLVLTKPLLIGGAQENFNRAGTENVPYIMGLSKCFDLIREHFVDVTPMSAPSHEKRLRDRLERFVLNNIKSVKINGMRAERVDGTSSISFLGIEGEGLIYGLADAEICIASGSACSSKTLEPSHVLKAMHVPFEYAHGTLRFSFGRYNTESDVEAVENALPEVVKRLRRLSPYWDNERDEFSSNPLR